MVEAQCPSWVKSEPRRLSKFSRRLWAPAQQGAQRETKWFYERARGQYADAQAKQSPADQRRFKAENPKPQMFAKTDLAKFENVWDEHPRWSQPRRTEELCKVCRADRQGVERLP
jgi:AIPR protein